MSKSSFNQVSDGLSSNGTITFILCVLGSAGLMSLMYGAFPLLITLAGFFAAFAYVVKFIEIAGK